MPELSAVDCDDVVSSPELAELSVEPEEVAVDSAVEAEEAEDVEVTVDVVPAEDWFPPPDCVSELPPLFTQPESEAASAAAAISFTMFL